MAERKNLLQILIKNGWNIYGLEHIVKLFNKVFNYKTHNKKNFNDFKDIILDNMKFRCYKFNNMKFYCTDNFTKDNKYKYPDYKNLNKLEKQYKFYNKYLKFCNTKNENSFIYYHSFYFHDIPVYFNNNREIGNYLKNNDKLFVKNILQDINFEEKDSLFYFFSDHGLGGNKHIDFENYWTWCAVKNNIENYKNKKLKTLCSSIDFYQTVLDIINHKNGNNDSETLYTNLNKNRKYFISDTRLSDNVFHSGTESVIKVLNWNIDDYPKDILQLTLIRGLMDTERKIRITYHKFKKEENFKVYDNIENTTSNQRFYDSNNYKTKEIFFNKLSEFKKFLLNSDNNLITDCKDLYNTLNKNCIYLDKINNLLENDKVKLLQKKIKKYKKPKNIYVIKNLLNKKIYRHTRIANFFKNIENEMLEYNNLIRNLKT